MSDGTGHAGLRRAAAALAAVAMVAGAWVVRSAVIDGADENAADDRPTTAPIRRVVCVSELADACRAAATPNGPEVVVADALDTLDELTDADADTLAATVWITFDGFPEALDQLRSGTGRQPTGWTTTAVAASPLVAVAPDAAQGECAADVWSCASLVGFPRPPHGATRMLATVVALDQTLVGGIDAATTSAGVVNARPLLSGLAENRLSSPSAIATMCNRPTFDLAVGPAVELDACASAVPLVATYSDEMVSALVVVAGSGATRSDTTDPTLVEALGDALRNTGWQAPGGSPGADGARLLLARTVWEQL